MTTAQKALRIAAPLLAIVLAASPAYPLNSMSKALDEMKATPSEELGKPISEDGLSVLTYDEEIARLEEMEAVQIQILNTELGQAVTTIAYELAGMEILAPRNEDFGGVINFNVKMNPYKALKMLARYYRFEMRYESGVWTFTREAPDTLVARSYRLKNTDLSQYEIGNNTTTNSDTGATTGNRIMKTDGEKLVADVKALLGVASKEREVVIMQSGDSLPMNLLRDTLGTPNRDETTISSKDNEASNGAKVIVIPDTNSLYIYASVAQHQLVENYLKEADRRPLWIKIDVTFVRTKRAAGEILGVDWSGAQTSLNAKNLYSIIDLNGDNRNPWPSQAQFSADDMKLQFDFISNDDDSEIFNEASVTTINNREVHFSVGTEEPFESAELEAGLGGGIGGSKTKIEFKHIGISLNVLPKVFDTDDESKEIRCVVKLSNTDLRGMREIGGNDVPVVGGQVNVFEFAIEDGYTQPFVGFSSFSDTFTENGVPFLKKVPLIGGAFRSRNKGKSMENIIGYLHVEIVEDRGLSKKPTREELREDNQVSGF